MRLRDLFEQHRGYLYHGTTLINALWIMRSGKLVGAEDGYGKPEGVSTSRNYSMALRFTEYNANNQEPYPVIFVIDWDKLRLKGKKTEPFNWEPDDETGTVKEMEEVIIGSVPLDFVVSININPASLRQALTDTEWQTEWQHAEYGNPAELQHAVKMLASDPRINKIIPRGAR